MKKNELFQGYRTIIFYSLATLFFISFIVWEKGLTAELWLIASTMFLGKNLSQSIVYEGLTIKTGPKNDNNTINTK